MRVVMETPLSERRAIVVPRVLVSPISHVPPSVSPQSAPVSGFVSPQGRAETSAAASPIRRADFSIRHGLLVNTGRVLYRGAIFHPDREREGDTIPLVGRGP